MSFFNNIFGKKEHKELREPIDLGILHTDIHSHLIPGIDDGSKTMEESISLVREMHNLGYKKLITTPHIMNDYYKNTPEIIISGLNKLKEAIAKENIDIEIEAAAEYMLDDGFEDKLKSGNLLTFGDKYILIEMSYMTESPILSSILFELQTEGYKVVLAHPERYNYWHNTFGKYQELRDRNVFLQLNINSLTGWYSPESRKIAKKLLENNMIQFLGSDLHNEQYLHELKKSRHSQTLKKHIDNTIFLNNTL
jgi:tyrosine-protein phosphatase YwqE